MSAPRRRLPRARTMAQNVEAGRSYALVLTLVLATYFVTGIAAGRGFTHVLVVLIQGAVLVFALRVSNASKRVMQVGVGLWLFLVLTGSAAVFGFGILEGGGVARFVSAALYGFTIVVIGINLARRDKVDGETILGVVTIYLLLGMFFAFLTMGIQAFMVPEPYFIDAAPTLTDESEFLFFSFVTLTTVGYGNLVPATELGQTLASFEAVCGTLFLILAIGRTISVADAEKRSAEEKELRRTIREETKKELAYLHDRLDAMGVERPEGDPPHASADDDGAPPR